MPRSNITPNSISSSRPSGSPPSRYRTCANADFRPTSVRRSSTQWLADARIASRPQPCSATSYAGFSDSGASRSTQWSFPQPRPRPSPRPRSPRPPSADRTPTRSMTSFVGRRRETRGSPPRLQQSRLVSLLRCRRRGQDAAGRGTRGPFRARLPRLRPVDRPRARPRSRRVCPPRPRPPSASPDQSSRAGDGQGDRPARSPGGLLIVLDNCEHLPSAASPFVAVPSSPRRRRSAVSPRAANRSGSPANSRIRPSAAEPPRADIEATAAPRTSPRSNRCRLLVDRAQGIVADFRLTDG